MGVDRWVDPILTWVGAAAVIAYLVYIHQRRTRSSLEGAMLVLLYALGALYVIRGFYWLSDDPRLEVLTYVPVSLVPLATTLFVEALLRRHTRLILKLFVGAGTVVFFTLNLVPLIERAAYFAGYRIFALTTFAWLGLVLVTRRRRAHSPVENRFINAFVLVLAFGFLVTMTDVRLRPEWLPLRMGGLGGLIFVYTCVRVTDLAESTGVLLWEIAGFAFKAAVLTVIAVLMAGTATPHVYVPVFFVALALVLLHTILDRIRELRVQGRHTSFYQWLVDARTHSLDEFIDSLDQLPLADDHLVLREADLDGYDPARMALTFDAAHPIWTLSGLRTELAQVTQEDDINDQLIALLEEHQMTHVTLLGRDPHAFFLLNLPQFAGSHTPVLEVALIQKYSRLLRWRGEGEGEGEGGKRGP